MSLLRKTTRRPARLATRMLGGARRPPPTNWLGLACRALKEVLRLDQRLRPYMAQQRELYERSLFAQEINAALCKIYGEDESGPGPAPQPAGGWIDSPKARTGLLKDEIALAKSEALLACLHAKLARKR